MHSKFMKHLLSFSVCLLSLLTACQSVRTVYDENGNEVKEREGGERSLEEYMQETFDKDVSRKKGESGVPQSASQKVSHYQKAIDEARKDNSVFSTGTFSGIKSFNGKTTFSGADKDFDKSQSYEGAATRASYNKDLRPDFMSDTKGVFNRDDLYGISSADRATADGSRHDTFNTGHTYDTNYSSSVSRDITSSYYESRKDNFKQPRIINHRDYYRKTIQETRTMLGRDQEPTEE